MGIESTTVALHTTPICLCATTASDTIYGQSKYYLPYKQKKIGTYTVPCSLKTPLTYKNACKMQVYKTSYPNAASLA